MDARLGLLHTGALLLLLHLPLKTLGAHRATVAASSSTAAGTYSNSWAVHITGGAHEAERIARKHGFVNHGNVSAGAAAAALVLVLGGGIQVCCNKRCVVS